MATQPELSFGNRGDAADGYQSWQRERRRALLEVGCSLGLPLGHKVAVELKDGCRLRGVLRLEEEGLFFDVGREPGRRPTLRVERCTFGLGDIVSCVRDDS